jgi:hypothetical protein
VDALQEQVSALVGVRLEAPRDAVFASVWRLAYEAAGLAAPVRREPGALPRAAVPFLNEPWYC